MLKGRLRGVVKNPLTAASGRGGPAVSWIFNSRIEDPMRRVARSAAIAFTVALLGAGAAVAAEACGCCPCDMACCDDKAAAPAKPGTSAPAEHAH